MRKFLALLLVAVMLLALSACAKKSTPTTAGQESTASTTNSTTESTKAETTKAETTQATQAVDLTGNWKQVNNESADSYQTATIQGNTIEVYWVSESDNSKSLYWAGSYAAPANASESFSWDSKNDKEKTDNAMLASGDDTKTFTYSNNQLSYSVSAMGTTTTVILQKQ